MTLAGVVGAALAAHGVDALYGEPLARLRVHRVSPPAVAARLADADARLTGGVAVAHLGDGLLHVSGGPGVAPAASTVADGPALVDRLPEALGAAAGAPSATTRLRLDVDLDAPAPPGAREAAATSADLPTWVAADPGVRDRLAAAEHPAMLVGPGVLRAGAGAGLHALATALRLGVVNTWGAKGVFDWRSAHHLGTAGLQARDFELAGLGAADLVVTCGLDAHEVTSPLGDAPRLDVLPAMLDPLAEVCDRPAAPIERGPLFERLAAVTQRGWGATGPLLPPSRCTRHYGEVLGPRGFLAADPGVAGFWVARTFPTRAPGSVVVPGAPGTAGFAAAAVAVARLRRPSRPALAVVDGPIDDATRETLEAVVPLGVAVPVETWDPAGDPLGPDEHLARLRAVVGAPRSRIVALACDPAQQAEIVDAAGEIVAWRETR